MPSKTIIETAGFLLQFARFQASLDVSSQTTTPDCVVLNNKGTKLYTGAATGGIFYQYSMSTAYDISSASYESKSLDASSEDSAMNYFIFNADGTKLFASGPTSGVIYQYSLSTAFDLSTATYDSVSLDVSTEDATPRGLAFNSDGTKLYVCGGANNKVFQYSLSTPYVLTGGSYDSSSFDVSSQDTSIRDIEFSPNGKKMFIMGRTNDRIFQYSLSPAFDVSSADYDSINKVVSSQESTPSGFTFGNNGTVLYVTGPNSDDLHEYISGFLY